MRAWKSAALATVATLLVASSASAQSSAPDAATLRAIESQVADIRGLKPATEPDLQLLDHTSLGTYLGDEFNRDYLPSERESDQKELVALGLIQPTDNLVQLELNLLNNQVIGVYDPDAKTLFVVNDEGAFGPAARITYAHEFNHALQDQYYGLNKIAPKHPDSNDRSLAVHGLIEGDAIMLQTIWASRNLTESDLSQLASDAGGGDNGLAEAPLILRSELLFPYTDGYNFVRQVYRQAGNTYAAVDAVFTEPPESTAQILHPDKYRSHVHPMAVDLGDVAASLGPAWRKVGGGVLGELDTRVLLEQYGATSIDANRVASAWSGDAWQLVETADGQSGIVLESTWDSEDNAAAFFRAYARGLRTRFSGATIDQATPAHEALSTSRNATDLSVAGQTVLAVIASDRTTADAILAATSSDL